MAVERSAQQSGAPARSVSGLVSVTDVDGFVVRICDLRLRSCARLVFLPDARGREMHTMYVTPGHLSPGALNYGIVSPILIALCPLAQRKHKEILRQLKYHPGIQVEINLVPKVRV